MAGSMPRTGYVQCLAVVATTIWLSNIAMENGPFMDHFPSYKPPFMRDFPWLCYPLVN